MDKKLILNLISVAFIAGCGPSRSDIIKYKEHGDAEKLLSVINYSGPKFLTPDSFSESGYFEATRFEAAIALGELGDTRAIKHILASVCIKEFAPSAIRAVSVLAKMGPPAVDPLIAALSDKDSNVRSVAANALGEMRELRAINPILASVRNGDLFEWDAARALARMGTPAVEPLIAALGDQNSHVRVAVVKALGYIGDKHAVQVLASTLKNDGNKSVREAALNALGDLRAEGHIISSLEDRDADIRRTALQIVSNKGMGPYAVEPLIAALRDINPNVRREAVRALAKTGDKRATSALIQLLSKEIDIDDKVAIADALGEIGDLNAIPILIQLMQEGSKLERRSHSYDIIYRKATKDELRGTAYEDMEGFIEVDEPIFLTSVTYPLRNAAHSALCRITKKDFGTDYRKWSDWLEENKKSGLIDPGETIENKIESKEQKPTVKLALKFTLNDSITYKVTTEAEDSIKYEGSLLNDPAIKNKSYQRNYNRTEIIETTQIQSTDDSGNAIALIRINGLKSHVIYQNNIVLDFDSSREADQNNPLNKLIGQHYIIEIAPSGEVVKIIDANSVRASVGTDHQTSQRTLMLLLEDAIKTRHTIQALPDEKRNSLHINDKWSKVNTFSFRQMGAKSYEKIYTLKKIKNINDKELAIVEMNAIPSSATAEELRTKQAISPITSFFDNVETYTGELQFDLTAGSVEKYNEKLRTEWVVADPNQKSDKEPGVIRMTAIRSYSLEKVE